MAKGFKDVDKGYKKKIASLFVKDKVSVGIFEESKADKYENGSSVYDVAEAHEFGLGVPERSFIRGWIDSDPQGIKRILTNVYKLFGAGKITREEALKEIGKRYQRSIRRNITDGIDPPNAKATIERKGSSTPLIDTKKLYLAIKYKIESKGK